MKLFYTAGACSLAPHIIAREAGLDLELVAVDPGTKTFGDDDDYRSINPRGQVPALVLEDGRVLTEGPAILQLLADMRPELGLVPCWGSFERYQAQQWLSFLAADVHKEFAPLFRKDASPEAKAVAQDRLAERFADIEGALAGRAYLMGRFGVVDAYAFVVLSWAGYVGINLVPWPRLARYLERIAARPAVQAAMRAEGLPAAA